MVLSKSTYLLYRECPKNAWIKVHKPEVYNSFPLSDFDKLIMKSGNEVELAARELFSNGILIDGRDALAQATTLSLIETAEPVIFQAVFKHNGFLAAADVLEYNPKSKKYNLYEIKAKNDVDKKTHYHDAAFQLNLLTNCGIAIDKVFIIHFKKDYVRFREINTKELFTITDITTEVRAIKEEVAYEMEQASAYLSQKNLPEGHCGCVRKGRSSHCTAFSYINAEIPSYSVHDITRIGNSKRILSELIDGDIMHIEKVPAHIRLSQPQQNQVHVHKTGQTLFDKAAVHKELLSLHFPLYFIDYETYAAPIPRYDGFSPYNHIPFQYALFVLENPESEPAYFEFLHTGSDDPSAAFVNSLKVHIGEKGTVIVWHKSFESTINKELGIRIPEEADYMESLNNRIYDLRDIFSKQHYVHKEFLGKTSIKNILPIMVPELSYHDLEIKNGGSASEMWNRLMVEEMGNEEREKIEKALREYCKLDSYAMYKIWQRLQMHCK